VWAPTGKIDPGEKFEERVDGPQLSVAVGAVHVAAAVQRPPLVKTVTGDGTFVSAGG
jgi:hypothetical protein